MRIRKQNHNPTELINDSEGQPVSNKNETRQRCKEYFGDLLNTTPGKNKTAQPMQESIEQETNILKEQKGVKHKKKIIPTLVRLECRMADETLRWGK